MASKLQETEMAVLDGMEKVPQPSPVAKQLKQMHFLVMLAIGFLFATLVTTVLVGGAFVMVGARFHQINERIAVVQPPLDRLLKVYDDASSATVRLVNGDLPSMVGTALNQDWKSVAQALSTTLNQMYNGFGPFMNDGGLDNVATAVSAVASVVEVIGQMDVPISGHNKPSESAVGGSDPTPQLTGEGGLIFEVINFANSFLNNQTDNQSWQNAGKQCKALADQLMGVVWSGTFFCPAWYDQAQVCSWDFTTGAIQVIQKVQQLCTVLVLMGDDGNTNAKTITN